MSKHMQSAVFLLFVCCLMAACACAFGQSAPGSAGVTINAHPVNPTQKALSRFETAMTSLSRQTQAAFVFEGQPYKPELTLKEAEKVALALRQEKTLDKVVSRVAAAFDYRTERLASHLYLFTKRYANANDLPDVPFNESVAAMQNIAKETQPFIAPLGSAGALRAIFISTPESRRTELSKGIPISSLTPEQQNMAYGFAARLELSALQDFTNVARRLNACRKPNAMFAFTDFQGYYVTDYEGAFDANGRHGWQSLSGIIQSSPGGGHSFAATKRFPILSSDLPDPTAPPPAPQILPQQSPSLSNPLSLTLAEATIELNKQGQQNAQGVLRFAVEPMLATKKVCLIGSEYESPSKILDGLAKVYGLRVRRENGSSTLLMQRPVILANVSEVPDEIYRLVPAPVLRKLSKLAGNDAAEGFLKDDGGIPAGILAPGDLFTAKDQAVEQSLYSEFTPDRAGALYLIAVHQLRCMIEPQMRQSPNHQIPILTSGSDCYNLLGLCEWASMIEDINAMTKPIAPYLSDFTSDTIAITLKSKPNDRSSFRFSIRNDANGQSSGFAGFHSGDDPLPPEISP